MEIKNKVIISVSGGMADVISQPENVEVTIIDWDNIEGGGCPVCGNHTLTENKKDEPMFCSDCNIDWSPLVDMDLEELLKALTEQKIL